MSYRGGRVAALACAACALGSQSAGAQVPYEDIGFAESTPGPDVDIVIARERAYGPEGVDLSAYGFGVETFVQSIYVRMFVDLDDQTTDSMAGRIEFPPSVRILGIVSDPTKLGGFSDDGLYSATDALFGVGLDPDAYSAESRGFECCGGIAGSSEFVCTTASNTLVFGLNVTNGVDDFRVLIDYGGSFAPELSFDVGLFQLSNLGGVTTHVGMRVGDDQNPVVPGSGDWGEIDALEDIPLTASADPSPSCNKLESLGRSVYVLRDTDDLTYVDCYDIDRKIPFPEVFGVGQDFLDLPEAISAGPDGLLYAIGQDAGYSVLEVHGGAGYKLYIPDLAGANVDLTWLAGGRELYFLRDTPNGPTLIDRFDVDKVVFEASYSISGAILPAPVGITEGADGRLYAIGQLKGFVALDPTGGPPEDLGLVVPGGAYLDIAGRPGTTKIYLLRRDSGVSIVDVYDFVTETYTPSFGAFPTADSRARITVGPDDRLYLFSQGVLGSSEQVILDADTGQLLYSNICLDFEGAIVDVAFVQPSADGTYCKPKVTSLGCTPHISTSGTPDLSDASPYVIQAIDVNSSTNGLLLYGYGPNNIVALGGALCVHPPLVRTLPQNSGGTPVASFDCSGVFTFDFEDWFASGADPFLEACQGIYAQYWFRDPADPFQAGLSNAVGFELR